MSATNNHLLIEAATAHMQAGRGERTAIVQRLADTLGVSMQTAYAHMKGALKSGAIRKPRKDKGGHALTREEAALIAGMVEASRRLTGSGELSIENAVAHLRANRDDFLAGRIDEETGEFVPLSLSAINRALRALGLHPNQLQQPTPATRLSSPHPNHCWQIDASVSRQFYLADDGAREMDQRVYYRGKPGNFVKINSMRLWRYVVTDHACGALEVLYVQGAESAMNLLTVLIHAMTQRSDGTMHGVPTYLMADPGSAVTAGPTRVFCDALDIKLIINAVGNARAKGQVENAQYIVETMFEAALKFRAPVTSIAEINALAAKWCRAFNATREHSRTGMTRRDGWLRITPAQLRIAPPVDVLKALPQSVPKTCTVRDWQIRFKGGVYDVRGLPQLLNGQRVEVTVNPFDVEGSVRVQTQDETGRPAQFLAPRIGLSDWGFQVGAAEIGSEFAAAPETPADAARKEVERLAMQVSTDAEAALARKRKAVPFGSSIDPSKTWANFDVVPSIPRAGTPSTIQAPAMVEAKPLIPTISPKYEPVPLSHIEMARELKRRVEDRGGTWSAELYARMAERWPDGTTEDDLDGCTRALMAPALRAVAGGAA